ncbi:MAG: hypothetical protein OEX12_15690 [Gammaproteobacteria bacterium]|nr:hypothetical protein [Gammaproteobacteria bacterium]
MMRAAIVLLLLFTTKISYAISVENHQYVSQVAIRSYQQCLSKLKMQDHLQQGEAAIAQYAPLEDQSPILDRYFNWHFYDAHRDTPQRMGRTITGARKSLHHIFQLRIQQLDEAIRTTDVDNIYNYSGRVMHYIQDMSVPAHVAPIYHYKFILDHSDYFDSIPEWTNTDDVTLTTEACQTLNHAKKDMSTGLKTILDISATHTLFRVSSTIPAPRDHILFGKTWASAFWNIRDPAKEADYPSDIKQGFAPYGEQGHDGFRRLCETDIGSVDHKLCMNFFQASYLQAIRSSVQALLLINHTISEHSIASP